MVNCLVGQNRLACFCFCCRSNQLLSSIDDDSDCNDDDNNDNIDLLFSLLPSTRRTVLCLACAPRNFPALDLQLLLQLSEIMDDVIVQYSMEEFF